jgi:hypothetical protein
VGYADVPNTLTLSMLAGLSIAGAAIGVQLGRSAINEIDPAYFRDPEVAFHGDLAANRGPDWAQVQAQEYAAAATPVTQCIGCVGRPVPDFPVEYVPGRDPYVNFAPDRWSPPVRHARAEVAEVAAYVEAEPDPVRERIVRYASYPVTQEEAREMAERDTAEQADGEDFAATQ